MCMECRAGQLRCLPASSSENFAPCLPWMMMEGKAATAELPGAPALSQPTLGHHLAILRSLETCLQLLFFLKPPVLVS